MGIEIKKNKYDELSVETDYGSGFLDHASVHENRTNLKNYMKETDRNSLKGDDYFDITQQIEKEKREKKEEERRSYNEWAREHSSRR